MGGVFKLSMGDRDTGAGGSCYGEDRSQRHLLRGRQEPEAPATGNRRFLSSTCLPGGRLVGMSGEFFPIADQVVRHLEERIRSGEWTGVMPGRDRLVAELGVSGKTVETALKRLEGMGLLEAAGAGKRRRIAGHIQTSRRALRVVIVVYEPVDRGLSYIVDLQHRLAQAGHVVEIARETTSGLGANEKRLAALITRHKADAWVLQAASLEVLRWFESRRIPAYAMFGRRRTVNLAGGGPDKIPVMRGLVRRLHGLGHQRMALLCLDERRKPYPAAMEQAFLDELQAHGMTTGSYNLPDWDNTPDGLRACLDKLFSVTPPTAIIFDETYQYLVSRQYLARKGILAPQHVSLICCDPDPWFDWYSPPATHIAWDPQPLVRHIIRWAGHIARGKDDRKQVDVPAHLVEGGTMGRAPILPPMERP